MTDVFNEIPGNPVPEKATGGFFAGFDGKKLRYGRFPAAARPLKGTVIVLPGRNECIEKYFETARPVRPRLHHGDPRLARPGRLRPAAARPAARPCQQTSPTM